MKKITFLLVLFIGSIGLMNAQNSLTSSDSSPESSVTIENLLTRLHNVDATEISKNLSSSSDFTSQEQRMLNVHFNGIQNIAPVVITHSNSQTITPGEEIACASPTSFRDNNLYRAFDLPGDFGIVNGLEVNAVEFAIGTISTPSGFPITANIWSTPGVFPGGTLTLQGTAVYTATNADAATIITLPLSAVIPAGETMVMELVLVDDGTDTNNMRFGCNSEGETGPSYIMAPECGANVPTPFFDLGLSQGLVWNVLGDDEPGGGGSFPDPYCAVDYSTVEPITLVEVAGINNRSSEVIDGSPAHEDFTAIVGNMEEGESYTIALEGNTGGGFTNSFTVFIDWNQDGILDNASERYEIGTIEDSSGTDGQQATNTITVPAGVTEGPTRMRVMKKFGSTFSVDSCTGTSWGQAEDYTINVTAAGGGIVYCIPEGTNSARFIDNFSTTGGSENISNMGSGFSAGGYGDFYDTDTVTQEQDGTVEFSADMEGGTAGFRIWVDWNQDGVFDVTQEVAYISSSYETNQTGSITVPTDALEGDTRMRVVSHWLSTTGDVDPCETGFTYGEFEDYKFTVEAGTGGGGECDQEHPLVGDAAGGSGSSQDSDFTTAADIVVVAGEDFTIDTILVPFLTFAPEDAPISATVTYYEDAAGLPGTEIGTETVVPTILSSGPWVNPVAFEFETQLDVTPFTFNGDASSDTSYWISITMGTATNQGTVFWEYTDDTPVEGQPYAKLDATIGDWTIDEPLQEVVYNFSGECSPLGVADNMLGGFTYYPNPTSGSLSLQSVSNIDSVSFFNLLGQKVMDVNINATTSEINLSGLNTGTYIMKVSVEGQIGTYKVLKN